MRRAREGPRIHYRMTRANMKGQIMKTETSEWVAIELCDDCVQLMANAETNPDWTEEETDAFVALVDANLGVGMTSLGHSGAEDCGTWTDEAHCQCEGWFSWSPCDGCRRPQGGTRHPAMHEIKDAPETFYVIYHNLPGYLPEGDVFAVTAAGAWWALREEIRFTYDHSDEDYDRQTLDDCEEAFRALDGRDTLDPAGESFMIGDCVYGAYPRSRAELEADGWTFDADGEPINDQI